jgi:putative membrane protein
MSKKILAVAMGVMLVFTLGAFADDEKKVSPIQTTSEQDQTPITAEKLLNKLHAKNLTEIELSKMAATKSDNQQVDEFANMLVRDHQQADQKIQQLAKTKNITLKTPLEQEVARSPESQTPADKQVADAKKQEKQADKERLQAMSGEQFDREYTMTMARNHNNTLAMLSKAKLDISDPEAKKLIGELEPTIRQHAERAETLARQLGGNPSQTVNTEDDRERTNK